MPGNYLSRDDSATHKATKKEGEFVLAGFGKLVKQTRKACAGIRPHYTKRKKSYVKALLQTP